MFTVHYTSLLWSFNATLLMNKYSVRAFQVHATISANDLNLDVELCFDQFNFCFKEVGLLV